MRKQAEQLPALKQAEPRKSTEDESGLKRQLEEALERRELEGDPLSLFGKLEFTAGSAGYFRLGRAALATLREWHAHRARDAEGDGGMPPAVLEALSFFHSVLPRLPPRRGLTRPRVSRRRAM